MVRVGAAADLGFGMRTALNAVDTETANQEHGLGVNGAPSYGLDLRRCG